MKRILIALALFIVLLTSILLIKTALFRSKQFPVTPETPIMLSQDKIIRHLQEAIRIPTISHQDPEQVDTQQFEALHQFLEETYPKVHRRLKKETVNTYSLLYHWRGSDPSLKPMLLMAHQDVVPVKPERWAHPPFSGDLAEGFIWGRGALDDKGSLLGILEAVEALLSEDFQPRRSVYIASGHDEEVGGRLGAAKIAALLASRNIEFDFALDEGLVVIEGMIPGMTQPAALIGLTEKGYLSLELKATGPAGHSSQPPAQTTLGILAGAVTKLEENPFPPSYQGPIREMFNYLGPEMAFPMRMIFANLWLLKPILMKQLLASPSTNASLRTTTAVTIMQGGEKENVLPAEARAIVNFRLLPGDSIAYVMEEVKRIIDDDRIAITALPNKNEPSPISAIDSGSFELLAKTARQIFPEAVAAPGMMLAGSDSHHYTDIAQNVYRFLPVQMDESDVARIHGADERISPENYLRSIRFYAQLIRNATQ